MEHLSHKLWSLASLFRQRGLRSAKRTQVSKGTERSFHSSPGESTEAVKALPWDKSLLKQKEGSRTSGNLAEKPHHWKMGDTATFSPQSMFFVVHLLFLIFFFFFYWKMRPYCFKSRVLYTAQFEAFCFRMGKKATTIIWNKSVLLITWAGRDGRNLKSPFVKRSPGFLSL